MIMTLKPFRTAGRGVVLIEALVALLIVAFGIVALGGLQSNLTRSADLARQRGDALRIANRELESLRAYAQFDDNAPASFASIQTKPPTAEPGSFNTEFLLERNIASSADGLLKSVRLRVNWLDRAGDPQWLTLDSFIDGADPALGFVIGQAPETSLRSVGGRNPGVPPSAKDLGDGRSAYKPAGASTTVLVFNNFTGLITSKCTVPVSLATSDLVVDDLNDCATVPNGYLLSGIVRFSLDSRPSSEAPSSPALPLTLQLWLTSLHHPLSPSYECYSDAPTSANATQTRVLYDCIVYPNIDTPPNWSGYLDLAGLSFTGNNATRVCRYSADADGDGKVSNAEHPEQYLGVTGALRNQNFLVIKGTDDCPAGHAVDPEQGYFTNTATVLHQDAAKPSHQPIP